MISREADTCVPFVGESLHLKNYFYPVLVLKYRHALQSVVIYLNNVIVTEMIRNFVIV